MCFLFVFVSFVFYRTFLFYSSDIAKENQEIKEFCLQFFVDIVIEFCFSAEAFELLDKETVLPHIMTYAFNQNNSGTKRFSPLEEYGVDNSPVVRSFILQQLLSR